MGDQPRNHKRNDYLASILMILVALVTLLIILVSFVKRQNRNKTEISQPISVASDIIEESAPDLQSDVSEEEPQDEREPVAEEQVIVSEPEEEASSEESFSEPELQNDDWMLTLVNRWHPLPEDYTFDLTELMNGQAVDSRIYPDLQAMFDDARAEGLRPHITESYRTREDQEAIMEYYVNVHLAEGLSEEEARAKAEETVAVPGTSEHELGLAVDITSENTEEQDASYIWNWLRDNAYQYGFILRYPEDKTDITGIDYEPWHYRYVGKEAAAEIYEQGVTLEEYLGETEHEQY